MVTDSNNFATSMVGNFVSISRLKELFPGLDDLAYSNIQKNVRVYSPMQVIMRQGKEINRTRLFKVEKGKVAIAYYQGNINDRLFMQNKIIKFLEVEAGERGLIPISLHSEIAPYSIIPISGNATVVHLSEDTLEEMLIHPKFSKDILKIQGDLLSSLCKNFPKIYPHPGLPIIPLLNVIGKFGKKDKETEKFLIAELRGVLTWIEEMNLESGGHIHNIQATPRSIGKQIIEAANSRETIIQPILFKLLSVYTKVRYFSPTLKKVKVADSSKTIDILEEAIELILKMFITAQSKVR